MVPVRPDPASTVLERLRALPAGARLLAALEAPTPAARPEGRRAPRVEGRLGGAFLVGGAVRDLLSGVEPHELDLVVEGDAHAIADELRRRLGGKGRTHQAFGTATIDTLDGLRVDVAQARTERYARPGALPDVVPARIEDDLARRDFTLNAIAVGISADVAGALRAVPHALEDLDAGVLRVLHPASFVDDPTRLLRLIRYAVRLSYTLDPETERLAREAFAGGAPRTAGVARIGRELLLLLREPDAVAALVLLRTLGGADELEIDEPVLRRVLALLPEDADRAAALLAALTWRLERSHRRGWLAGIHVRGGADGIDAAARDPEGVAAAMRGAGSASALRAALAGVPVEGVVLAAALDPRAEDAARRWLDEVRHVRLAIGGADLLDRGVPRGPEIGRRLGIALAAKLDGRAETREEELAAALADQGR